MQDKTLNLLDKDSLSYLFSFLRPTDLNQTSLVCQVFYLAALSAWQYKVHLFSDELIKLEDSKKTFWAIYNTPLNRYAHLPGVKKFYNKCRRQEMLSADELAIFYPVLLEFDNQIERDKIFDQLIGNSLPKPKPTSWIEKINFFSYSRKEEDESYLETNRCFTLLHWAVIFNQTISYLKKLLKAGHQVGEKDSDGHTILHLASVLGHIDIVKWLVEQDYFDLSEQTNALKTAVHLCRDDFDLASILSTSENILLKDKTQLSAFHQAIKFGEFNKFKAFLSCVE